MKRFEKQGFTLVEIMIVVLILGLLAAIGIPYVLYAYDNSQSEVQARAVAEVEKAKRILTLPSAARIPGAMGLSDENLNLQENAETTSNLCSALRIESLDALTIGGKPISVGTLRRKASY